MHEERHLEGISRTIIMLVCTPDTGSGRYSSPRMRSSTGAARLGAVPFVGRVRAAIDELDIAPDQGSGEFAAAPRGEVDVVEVVVVEAFDDVLDELFGEVEE